MADAYAILDNNNEVVGHVHTQDEAQHYIDENTYQYVTAPLGYAPIPIDVLLRRGVVLCIECGRRITR